MTRVRTIGSSLLASLPAVVLAAGGGAAFMFHTSAIGQTPVVPTVPPAASVRGLPDFTDLVDAVGPSVVNIRTLERSAPARPGAAPGGAPDEEMLEFFRRFGIPIPPGAVPRGPRQERGNPEDARPRGVGSGFVLSADGFIMTNAHVVEGADELLVTLPDKREFKARIVGADKRTDVAVVKIEATGLAAVRIGDVSRLRVGEWVMAIGSPFGLENTVTAGIVSAKQRDTGEYLPFIQTDVAINPGNSGGPLFNMKGEVVGINSQIFTRSGGFMGLSFAIPMSVALDVADQLKSDGKVSRGWLGVVIQEVNKDLAESFGLERPAGALVAQVLEDGPAAKGGLQVGDVILNLDGKPIIMSADLPHRVGALKPGSMAELDVVRDGARKTLKLAVGALPEDGDALASAAAPGVERSSNRLGVAVVELNDEQRKAFDLKGGVVIKEVQDGPAAMIGLRPGDVITHVAGREVGTVAQLLSAVAALPPGTPATMDVVRRDGKTQLNVTPARRNPLPRQEQR